MMLRRLWNNLKMRTRRMFSRPTCPTCGRKAKLFGTPERRPQCIHCWIAEVRLTQVQLAEARSMQCRTSRCGSRKL